MTTGLWRVLLLLLPAISHSHSDLQPDPPFLQHMLLVFRFRCVTWSVAASCPLPFLQSLKSCCKLH